MYDKIKFTLVPENIVEDGLLESAILLTENADIESPIILFNEELEIGLESVYEDDVDKEDIKYVSKKDLDKVLEIECKNDDYGNCIIINGFDITLNEVREKYAEMSYKSNKIFSINNIVDTREYTNFTVNIPMKVYEMYTDEEWDEYKKSIDEQFEESLKQDLKGLSVNNVNDNDQIMNLDDILDLFFVPLDKKIDLPKEDKKQDNSIVPVSKPSTSISSNYNEQTYSYINNNGLVEASLIDDETITLSDGEDMIYINESHIDFIIETLEKFKYNKDK